MQEGRGDAEAGAAQPIDRSREVHQATLCSEVEDSKQPGDPHTQGTRNGTSRLVVQDHEVGGDLAGELDHGALTPV
jgi:hypothetical protein